MKILSVVGARPNFMKIAPFIRVIQMKNELENANIKHYLVHTGQHYDDRMSDSFFNELNIPEADFNLGIGSGTHAEQVGYTMIEFEKVLRKLKPDWVVVVGDVNATLACSVTAKKELVKVCHIEAGLRSCDLGMAEEINRLVTDRISDLLLTPDEISSDNLRKEGADEHRIKLVGNIMIDTLDANFKKAQSLNIHDILENNICDFYKNNPGINSKPAMTEGSSFALVTIHRPSNVDDKPVLSALMNFIVEEVCHDMPVIWPIHPRTRKNLEIFGLSEKIIKCSNLILLEPLGYLSMLRLNMGASLMMTDSGGLQEECTVLGTPCLTLRWNTERPVTLREYGGASVLVGNNIERIREEYRNTLQTKFKPMRPPLWDGHTAERCIQAILDYPS